MRLKHWKYLAAIVTGSAVLAMLWYPNRTVCKEDDYWGERCYELRWGKGVKLTIDRDMNGVLDVLATYSGGGGHDAIYTHAVPSEVWEDWDNDGRFERHLIYDERELTVLHLDTNRDGIYDKKLLGNEAREYLKENPWPGV